MPSAHVMLLCRSQLRGERDLNPRDVRTSTGQKPDALDRAWLSPHGLHSSDNAKKMIVERITLPTIVGDVLTFPTTINKCIWLYKYIRMIVTPVKK